MSPVEVGIQSAILVYVFAMGMILSQRSANADREQGRLQQEIAVAGEVQRLLPLGDNLEAPGFDLSPVYLPASEVGGDCFHVRPLSDGGCRL